MGMARFFQLRLPMRKPRSLLDPSYPLHLTGRTHGRMTFGLHLDDTWELFQETLFFLHHAYQIRIFSFVLMPNHFHAIASAPNQNLSKAMAYFMGTVARELNFRLNRESQMWGSRFYSTVLGTHRYFLNCYKYIYQNPLRAGLANRVEAYPYSTLHGLLGFRKMLVPLEADSFLIDNPESALRWLNMLPNEADLLAMRRALSRREFSLPRDRRSGHVHHLASASF